MILYMKAVLIPFVLIFISTLAFGSEKVLWTDFYNSTVKEGNLIHFSQETGYATAKSQQLIYNSSYWEVKYNLELEGATKVWGIVKQDKTPSLAEMEFGFHLSNSNDEKLTIFSYGRSIKSFSLSRVNEIKIESTNGTLKAYLDQNLIYSNTFNTENIYNVMGMVEQITSLDSLMFYTDHIKTFEYSIEPYTQSGEINVKLPPNAPSGPYHYLLNKDEYVDLGNLYNEINNSGYLAIDSNFFNAPYTSTSHKFYFSEVGQFFVSALEQNLSVISRDTINILPKIDPLSTTFFSLEGKHYIAGDRYSFTDLPAHLDLNRKGQEISIQFEYISSPQYFGFGIDSIPMSSLNDLKIGVMVKNDSLHSIVNGAVRESYSMNTSDTISLKFHKESQEFYLYLNNQLYDKIPLDKNDGAFIERGLYQYNLKMGIEQVGIFFNPIIINFPFTLYNLGVRVTHLNCSEENTGSIGFSPFASLSWFYQVDSYSLTLYDDNNQQVGTVNQLNYNNLAPGNYTVTGNILASTIFPFNLSFNFPVNQTIEIGYKADWLTLDNNYVENPNNYSVLVQGHNEQSYLQGRSKNYLKYIDEGWVKYKPVIPNQQGTELMRYETSNLSVSPTQLGIFNEDFLAHHRFWGINFKQLYSSISGYSPITSISDNDEVKIKFTTNSNPNSQYGENEVLINNNSYSIIPRTNSNISVIPNSILNDYGFKNVITSFGCPTSENIYAHLKYELDGFYHTMKDGEINFVFDQEYEGENLQFNIYNSLDEIVKTQADFPVVPTSYGKNYITIDVSTVDYCIGKGFLYLETINSKGEKKYLRFYNDYFVDGCALDNLEYEENNPTE